MINRAPSTMIVFIFSWFAFGVRAQEATCSKDEKNIFEKDICAETQSLEECAALRAFVKWGFEKTVKIKVTSLRGEDTYNVLGSGVIVSGGILTAAHVVREAQSISAEIREIDFNKKEVNTVRSIPLRMIIWIDKFDTAFLVPLKKGDELPASIPLAKNKLKPNSILWNFGVVTGWEKGEFRGFVYPHLRFIQRLFQGEVCGWHGDSGGPIINDQGRLVGMLIQVDKKNGQPIFFVHVEDIFMIIHLIMPFTKTIVGEEILRPFFY